MSDIEELILGHEHTVTYDWRDWFDRRVENDVVIPGVGTVNVEDVHFGYGGDDSYLILRVENDDTVKYYKKSFYDSSYGFSDVGPFKEVQPTIRTLIEFK